MTLKRKTKQVILIETKARSEGGIQNMSRWTKLFVVFELLLFIWLLFQLTTTFILMVLLFLGFFLLSRKKPSSKKTISTQQQFGIFLIVFSLLSTQAAWAMLLVASVYVFFVLFKGNDLFAKNSTGQVPWKQKTFFSVDSLDSSRKSSLLKKTKWIGRDHLGSTEFEWEDMNYIKCMGETVIDLGNTLLPQKENVVIIRKGFGKTKILVPNEVGITVNYTSLHGLFISEEETLRLKNEQLKYIEKEYANKPRKLHIIVSVLIGDLEVVSL